MKNYFLIICIISIFVFGLTMHCNAQTTVIFNLNLKPQLEDSSFIPDRDILEVTGNLYPFGYNKNIKLEDLAPVDSIYTVEVNFSGAENNKTLEYNFLIRTEREEFKENRPRVLELHNGTIALDALYFNAFAW